MRPVHNAGAIITRFAPAPTGFLHLGHVVNAIVVWGVARACGGRVLLRIEDHDRQRSRAVFDQAILEDLEWLGFEADGPLVRQSARGEIYSRALEDLRARGLVYACACSRSTIAEAQRASVQVVETPYPGSCRDRNVVEGRGTSVRVRMEPSVERFVDIRHGPQEQRPADQCGDLVVRDRVGNWSYQFAAALDDYLQGVTMVIRGDDLLQSTGRQLQLARRFGRSEPPQFLHHPLIMKSASRKLSKSDRDTGIRDLKAAGWHAESVIGEAAVRAGLIAVKRDIHAREVSTIIPGAWR
jgi:glutamyl-tRNA synthetase/glutamyl-Q tRNA(Asp) synthetase